MSAVTYVAGNLLLVCRRDNISGETYSMRLLWHGMPSTARLVGTVAVVTVYGGRLPAIPCRRVRRCRRRAARGGILCIKASAVEEWACTAWWAVLVARLSASFWRRGRLAAWEACTTTTYHLPAAAWRAWYGACMLGVIVALLPAFSTREGGTPVLPAGRADGCGRASNAGVWNACLLLSVWRTIV